MNPLRGWLVVILCILVFLRCYLDKNLDLVEHSYLYRIPYAFWMVRGTLYLLELLTWIQRYD